MGHLIKKPPIMVSKFNPSLSKRVVKTCLCLLIVVVFISLSSCINGRETQIPDSPKPTTTPTQEQIIFPEFLNPTDQIFSTDESELKIAFEAVSFTHPDNLFSLEISENWQIEVSRYGAKITDPQNQLAITVTLVNTGYPLNEESFKNFIDIQEENASADFTEFVQIENHEIAKEKSILITKLVSLEDNEKKFASNYQQHDNLILKIDFLSDPDIFNANSSTFIEIINSANVNLERARELDLYSFDDADRLSNGYFSILVPPFWRSDKIEDEYSTLYTFLSPDNQAVIQMIVYDDGNHMSNTIAAGFALKLLRDNYAKDIFVLKDEILPDGREKLQWRSETANYHGETAFTSCGSALFMMTVMSDEDFTPIYQELLDDVIASYSVEVACN